MNCEPQATITTMNIYELDQGKPGNAIGNSRNWHKANEMSEKCEVQITKLPDNRARQISANATNANRTQTTITIMDIYSILYYYDECSNEINTDHNMYSCICHESFTKKTDVDIGFDDIRNSIKNHYEKTKIVKQLYMNYKNYIIDNFDSSIRFTYNINHIVKLNNIEDN